MCGCDSAVGDVLAVALLEDQWRSHSPEQTTETHLQCPQEAKSSRTFVGEIATAREVQSNARLNADEGNIVSNDYTAFQSDELNWFTILWLSAKRRLTER